MTNATDNLLLLMIGSGYSDKRVKNALDELSASDTEVTVRRFRALKRALSNVPTPKPKTTRSISSDVEKALKLLRSSGPYSEHEMARLLNDRAGDLFIGTSVPKGGLQAWLNSFSEAVGSDKMLDMVSRLRNELVHNPRPGWSIKDVR